VGSASSLHGVTAPVDDAFSAIIPNSTRAMMLDANKSRADCLAV